MKPTAPTHAGATALIAEDEPLLARALAHLLAKTWPELKVVAMAEDGPSAIEAALLHTPDVIFLDIKMPGQTGLEVAEVVADDWPAERAEPLFVFVTAFDEFAVAAFERAAADYVLKPITAERLQLTVARLRQRLAARAPTPAEGDLARLFKGVQAIPAQRDAQNSAQTGAQADAPADAPPERIRLLRAGVGNTVRMIPVAEVICFEATDKYVNVVTATGEALVRMSMRELVARIDAVDFMQVHRSVVVNAAQILSATRDELGHYTLSLRGLARPVKVSRAFTHLFRPM